jgi:FixJ family two-component response regulator
VTSDHPIQSTVSLIGDDPKIRTTLSRALTKSDFTVQAYETAADFLDAYKASQPGCPVLDYGLPEMNGLEL